MVRIKYYGFLKAKLPQEFDEEGFCNLNLAGKSLESYFAETTVDPNMRMTILVNSSRKDKSYVMQDGDVITVMPLVAGG